MLADNFWGVNEDVDRTGQGVLKFVALPETYITFFIAVAVIAYVVWVYRRERDSATAFWRTACGLMRCCALAILLIILFQPALVSVQMRQQRSVVAVLFDTSLSMGFSDHYEDDADVAALALALDLIKPGEALTLDIRQNLESMSRLEIVNRLMDTQGYDMLASLSENQDVKVFTFSSALVEAERLQASADATATGASKSQSRFAGFSTDTDAGIYTRMGNALADILKKFPPGELTSIIVVSDGRSNSGVNPVDVVDNFTFSGVQVYCVGVGDYNPQKDIELLNPQHPERVQINIATKFSVDIKSSNFEGQETEAVFTMLSRRAPEGSWEEVNQILEIENIVLPSNNELQRLEFSHIFLKNDLGDYRMRIAINPEGGEQELGGEISRNNNVIDFRIEVVSDKLKILYLEGYPRYEYRYLKNAMLRDNENLEVHCYLFSADKEFTQECTAGLDSIVDFPDEFRTLEALAKYDCVIIGDINPSSSEIPQEFKDNLVTFVQRLNGGVIFIAGEFYMPRQFAETPMYDLLPIVLNEDAGRRSSSGEPITMSFTPELSAAGRGSDILRLLDDPASNIELWEDHDGENDGLPGLYWYYKDIERVTPGATVLLQHPTEVNTETNKKHPIIVSAKNGSGFVLYIGTDDSWRWRFLVDDLYMYRFYRNSITYVTGGRLMPSKRFDIQTNKDRYDQHEEVEILVKALDSNLEPYADPATGEIVTEYPLLISRPGVDEPIQLMLHLGDDELSKRNGLYKATFSDLDASGQWHLEVLDMRPATDDEPVEKATKRFDVFTKSLEDKDPKMDKAGLDRLAKKTGAKFFFPWDMKEIPGYIDTQPRMVQGSVKTDELWDSPFMFMLLLLVLTLEWCIRRWKRLA